MSYDIAATGFVGIAFETTAGTYVAPTKFFPIRSESLKYNQDTQWRRVIRGIADLLGAIPGNVHIDGDIEMELLHDVLPYFLLASRNTVVKSGAAAPYSYVTTPQHGAQTAPSAIGKPTLSITVVRDGVAFGYTGCQVGSMRFSQDAGTATMAFSIIGRDEANAAVPAAPVFSSTAPYGAGTYSIQVPTATQVFDVDNFELAVEEGLEPQFRLQSTRGARFGKYGERDVTLTLERDFSNRADYDAFKALTAQSVTLQLTSGTNVVTFKIPVSIKEAYEVGGLSSQGDLIRSSIPYKGIYDPATSKSYEITVATTENIA